MKVFTSLKLFSDANVSYAVRRLHFEKKYKRPSPSISQGESTTSNVAKKTTKPKTATEGTQKLTSKAKEQLETLKQFKAFMAAIGPKKRVKSTEKTGSKEKDDETDYWQKVLSEGNPDEAEVWNPISEEEANLTDKVLIWGRGTRGQLGLGKNITEQLTPKELVFPGGAKIKRLFCGSNHTLALSHSNLLFDFGVGKFGQLGNAQRNIEYKPYEIHLGAFNLLQIQHVAAGGHHTVVSVSAPGGKSQWEAFACGRNMNGQLGVAFKSTFLSLPTEILALKGRKLTALAAGEDFTVAATEDLLFTFGKGDVGQHITDE